MTLWTKCLTLYADLDHRHSSFSPFNGQIWKLIKYFAFVRFLLISAKAYQFFCFWFVISLPFVNTRIIWIKYVFIQFLFLIFPLLFSHDMAHLNMDKSLPIHMHMLHIIRYLPTGDRYASCVTGDSATNNVLALALFATSQTCIIYILLDANTGIARNNQPGRSPSILCSRCYCAHSSHGQIRFIRIRLSVHKEIEW